MSFNTPTSSGAACARCSPSMLRATVADPPAIDHASITGGHGFARRHSPGFSIDTSLGGERAIYSTQGSPIAIGQGAPGLVAMLVGRTKREKDRGRSQKRSATVLLTKGRSVVLADRCVAALTFAACTSTLPARTERSPGSRIPGCDHSARMGSISFL